MSKATKKPRMPDPMQFAISIVEGVTGENLVERPEVPAKPVKSPAAVARGKKGGPKGGVARAMRLTPSQRKKIAQNAAKARWNKTSDTKS